MSSTGFAVDGQSKHLWQPKDASDTKTGAARRQVIDGARMFCACRTELNHPTLMCGNADNSSAFNHCSNSERIVGNVAIERGHSNCLGQHIRSRPLAGITNVSIAVHVVSEWMGRDGDVQHEGSAFRTNCSWDVHIGMGHGWLSLQIFGRSNGG